MIFVAEVPPITMNAFKIFSSPLQIRPNSFREGLCSILNDNSLEVYFALVIDIDGHPINSIFPSEGATHVIYSRCTTSADLYKQKEQYVYYKFWATINFGLPCNGRA